MQVASTNTTSPSLFALTKVPESSATFFSKPVPTTGASERSSGTACLCILEPIRARFASSCSRKGISPAATDTICMGETSIKSTFGVSMSFTEISLMLGKFGNSPSALTKTNSLVNLLVLGSKMVLAGAILHLSSS